jgi:hypothetical protein
MARGSLRAATVLMVVALVAAPARGATEHAASRPEHAASRLERAGARAEQAGARSHRAAPQRWRPAFGIARPVARQLVGPQLALTAGGQAIAYTSVAENDPADSLALLFAGPPAGRITAPAPILGVQQVLALAYLGRTLALLVGASPRGLRCCSRISVLLRRGRWPVSRQLLLRRLAGPALGALLVIHGRLMAAIASAQGVWDDRGAGDGRFGAPRRLWGGSSAPGALAAAAPDPQATALAFSARTSPFAAPDEIFTAVAGGARAPAGAHIRVRAPDGYEIDELALAGAHGSATLAWVQSGLDASGAYASQVYATQLTATGSAQAISPPGQLASGLSLAENGGGAAVLAYRSCTRAGACELEAALSPQARRGFAPAQSLGAIDPTQVPATAISRRGQALVGFVSSSGDPLAVTAAPGARLFGLAHRLARVGDASQVALSFDPAGDAALAVWTQGIGAQSLVGARLTG